MDSLYGFTLVKRLKSQKYMLFIEDLMKMHYFHRNHYQFKILIKMKRKPLTSWLMCVTPASAILITNLFSIFVREFELK